MIFKLNQLIFQRYFIKRKYGICKLKYDVIVVGGGHAGCESAAAATRCGMKTLLITHKKTAIGEMSCNPSFGGVGKGHLIREIDALDGLCGRICDKSAITYQALNRSKGPAVIGLRAQIDRDLYKKAMQKEILENISNLDIIENLVEDLIVESISDSSIYKYKIKGCILNNQKIVYSPTIIITTGTFLNGEMFCGFEKKKGGRINDHCSVKLANFFKKMKFNCGRLRTGTPPRLLATSINFNEFDKLLPDNSIIPFSFMTNKNCINTSKHLLTYIGYTNSKVAELVLKSLESSIHVQSNVTGPRSCPSLEAKILRFPHLKHRFFLEPEGFNSKIIYPGGLGLSCNENSQLKILRSVSGLEKVEILTHGYGVQYDYINPQQLKKNLETKLIKGLFLAGQINGTTGYEEAAAQGIMAGINAAQHVKNKEPFILDRFQGYIGVLIDDLTTLGTNEPYRMYTSRAEFRLYLRPDNADIRLTELGYKIGVVGKNRYRKFCDFFERFNECKQKLESIKHSLQSWNKLLPFLNVNEKPKILNGFELLSQYHKIVTIKKLATFMPDFVKFAHDDQLEYILKCEGRYTKWNSVINLNEMRCEENLKLPRSINYWAINELNFECREKLDYFKPSNIAAASRIQGITPDALLYLMKLSKREMNNKYFFKQ